MKLYNTFTGGAMNKDVEVRLLPKNIYTDAKNVRIITPDDNNSRSVKLPLGNTLESSIVLNGTNVTCIGSCVDNFNNTIYWAVSTSTHSYICEYNTETGADSAIVRDAKSGGSGLFSFTNAMYIEMRVINDSENGRRFLVLTDGVNEPKFFDIDIIRAIAPDSYTADDVFLIKAPPINAPTITLANTASNQENNLETKFVSFAYRYKYQNGEWSALSPFSEFAFFPDEFSYNLKGGINNSMFNNFSKAEIAINTGISNVSDIQLIAKESGSNTAYIVDTYNKNKYSWSDNSNEIIEFDNSRIYKALDPNQLSRVYDNVPIKAGTLEVIGNRIIFGNYTEGYDLLYEGSEINTKLNLSYTSSSGTAGAPHKQVKTNRDYEIAISYLDGKGRMTTPIVSDNNTTFVPYSESNKKVQLELTIDSQSRPPEWAEKYRLFIKQSKTDYDVISPIIFYTQGVYSWIKLEGNDIQKVREGDFIYVKSDTSSLKESSIRAKVLEVTTKDANFLQDEDPVPYKIINQAGTYMKIEVSGFSLSESAANLHNWDGFSFRSPSTSNNILNSISYIEPVYYEGQDLNDLTVSGTITGDNDIRFEVEIDGVGTPDTFRWRAWNVSDDNDPPATWTSGVSITGSSQLLSNGISITFGSTNGHTINDKWFVSAKSATRINDWNRGAYSLPRPAEAHAIVLIQSKDTEDESIKAGASILISYDDTGSDDTIIKQGFISFSLTSSKNYPNIEEWFYGDNVMSQLDGLVWNNDINNVLFRRGTLTKTDGQQMTVTGDHDDRMYMAFLSYAEGWDIFRINNSLNITELNNNIIFETIPVDTNTDIFYELPYTYDISGNVHLGNTSNGDTNQIYGTQNAIINIPYFNSFGWYNGYESYKIGDTFNEKTMVVDTKPLVPVDNYQQIQRIASLTYSDVYESTTQVNALNEFNLAELNYKDLDIRYGAIRKLHTTDTDLLVFQHDKTHRVLYNKSVLYNADGTGSVSQSANVLGQEIGYAGEYGISNNPESFAFYGNRIYHLDRDRGALMRLSVDGYTEISQNGMSDYFRKLPSQSAFVGGYDPYNDEYLINVKSLGDPLTLAFKEQIGFTSFYGYLPERLIGINNRLYSIKTGQIYLHDSNSERNKYYGTQRGASITTVFNDSPTETKHFKSVNLESDSPWITALTTNFNNGEIYTSEYELSEGEYYAYIRQAQSNTTESLTEDTAIIGIGEVASINGNVVTIDGTLPRSMQAGKALSIYVSNSFVNVGTVSSYTSNAITLTSAPVGLSVGDFVVTRKDARVEGEALKGYYLEMNLTNNTSSDIELFAVKVEAVKSFD
jgi:hypothetical protein